MNTKYIVDFDDFCDETAYTLDTLDAIKDEYEDFQATLFTIPSRTSAATIERAKRRPWLSLAPHGWFHTRGECLGWTAEEAEEKLLAAKDMGIDAPVFRAPAWLCDEELYQACAKLGYAMASHAEMRMSMEGVKEYVYNAPQWRPKKSRAIHGHLTPVCGNHIVEMWANGEIAFRKKREFVSVLEAVREVR